MEDGPVKEPPRALRLPPTVIGQRLMHGIRLHVRAIDSHAFNQRTYL